MTVPAAAGSPSAVHGGTGAPDERYLAYREHRPMLYGLAYRMLGSVHDADDVLQEAYLRWTRADRADVAEPRRYLTRVVARLALDALRARQARREEYVGTWLPEPVSTEPSPFGAVDTSELSIAVLHLYVDGTYAATVDTKAPSSLYRQIQWTRSWSSGSRHTIKIKVAGTSGRPTIALDGLAYIG